MKVYSQAKDQIVLEDVTGGPSGFTVANFFSYGKQVGNVVKSKLDNGDDFYTVSYDPAVAFFSKTTTKHFKKFVEKYMPRPDIWYLVKKHSQIQGVTGDLNTCDFSISAVTLA